VQEIGTSAENMMQTTRGLSGGRRLTKMASVDLLAGVTWRVNRTTPAASSATAAAVAHGNRHATVPQHLHRTQPAQRRLILQVNCQQDSDSVSRTECLSCIGKCQRDQRPALGWHQPDEQLRLNQAQAGDVFSCMHAWPASLQHVCCGESLCSWPADLDALSQRVSTWKQ